jgi:hypothetical protein
MGLRISQTMGCALFKRSFRLPDGDYLSSLEGVRGGVV